MIKFEEIIKKAKGVKLSKPEKAELRANLLVRVGIAERPVMQRSIINFLKPMPIFALFLAVALLGGGVSFAAEGSLPGDVLYPVKLKVNEEVKAAVSLSAEAKANWEAKRAERRLEEAEKLAASGKLDAETRAKIESNFEKHAARVQERIATLETRSDVRAAADVSSKLETSLRAHGKILRKFADAESSAAKVTAQADKASKSRALIEAKISDVDENEEEDEDREGIEEAAMDKLRAAEGKINEVREFLREHGDNSSAEAEARLKIAENIIIEGKAKLGEAKYGEAFLLFQKAHRVAQEAKLLLKAESDLKIDIEEELFEAKIEGKIRLDL